MPYQSRNRRYKRKYNRNYRTQTSSNPTWSSTAIKVATPAMQAIAAAAAQRIIKNYLNVERKLSEDSNTALNVAYDNIQRLDLTPILLQGDTAGSRSGRSVKWVTIQHNANIIKQDSTNQNTVRVMVVWVKSVGGQATSTAEILDGQAGAANYITAFRELDNASNYRVMFDKVYTLTDDKPTLNFRFFRKVALRTKYALSTSVDSISSVEHGHLYAFYLSDIANASTPPVLDYQTRSRFVDN